MNKKPTLSDQLVTLSTFSVNTPAFKLYLGEIFLHFIKRNYPKKASALNFFQFHDYLNLPMFISQKLINTLGNASVLQQEEFINGLYTLYCGTIELRVQLMLKFFDFKCTGFIYADDILLIFSHFHMMFNQKGIDMLHDIVKSALQGRKKITVSELSNVINATNSDVLFLFIFYFTKAKPFHEEQINYFWNNLPQTESGCLGIKLKSKFSNVEIAQITEKTEVIAPPSEKLLSYLHDFMECNIIAQTTTEIEESFSELHYLDSVEEELSEILYDFENDAKTFNIVKLNTMNSFRNSCDKKEPKEKDDKVSSDGSLPSEKSSVCILENLIDGTLIPSRRNSHTSNNSKELNSSTQSSKNLSSGGSSIQDIMKLYSIGKKNKLRKCKVCIVKDNLFYFKYDEQTHSFQMKKIISLKSVFIKECEEFSQHNTKYFAVKLLYNFDQLKNGYAFASSDEKDILTLKSLVIAATNFKRLEDEYILENEIGKGQFGKVKLCVNKITGEQCAVKTVVKSKLKSTDIQMIKWEIDIFKLFKNAHHPNVIQSKDIYETSSFIHFVYEYVPFNLNTYLISRTEYLSPTEMKCMIYQLTSAVHFIHFFGIVHRDLKQDNILVNVQKDNSIQLKIIDFGLSKVMGRHETAREPFGSLCYAAPEILCQVPYSHKVDVWSLGVIAYYLRYAVLPFDDSSNDLGKITSLVIQGKFKISSDEAEYDEINKVITSCLNTNSQKRAGTEELIYHLQI